MQKTKPKKPSFSPTSRTMRFLKQQGLPCAIVEKWNPFAGQRGKRHDLFGIIDVIALDPKRGVVGIQCCGSSLSAHMRKIIDDKHEWTRYWLETPGTQLEIWSWRLRKKKLVKGFSQKYYWMPTVKQITLGDLDDGRSERPEGEDPLWDDSEDVDEA